MKKIEVIVEPSVVEDVAYGLKGIGVHDIAVTEVHDFGASGGRMLVCRGMKYRAPYLTEAKIEMIVTDETADRVIPFLQQSAKRDEAGETRVFVFSLDDTARTRMTRKSVATM